MTAALEGLQEIRLSKLEQQALTAWDGGGEDIMGFRSIAVYSGIDRRLVRRVVRAMARKGVTEYHRCGWNDEGQIGAGYALTDVGRALIAKESA